MSDTLKTLTAGLAFLITLAACGGGDAGDTLTGQVVIDGSSTVFPIAEAVAEEFQIAHPRTRISAGFSGTGGGFKRFCAGETDISNASRPITEAEAADCAANEIEFTELPVAIDGLSVIVHPENDFVECLTVEELERIWSPRSQVRTWRDVRSEWPAREISLFGPGTDSGTFDYFTATVMGESGASRADYQASEDDNILVQGVAGDPDAFGYFGYAYYVENQGRLRTVAVDGGEGCVLPTEETIASERYTPLSRPLFFYVKHAALERSVVREYVRFMLENAPELVPSTGYLAVSAEEYGEQLRRIEAAADAG